MGPKQFFDVVMIISFCYIGWQIQLSYSVGCVSSENSVEILVKGDLNEGVFEF